MQILRAGGENNENLMLFIFNIANIIHSYCQMWIFHLSADFSALTPRYYYSFTLSHLLEITVGFFFVLKRFATLFQKSLQLIPKSLIFPPQMLRVSMLAQTVFKAGSAMVIFLNLMMRLGSLCLGLLESS